MKPLNTVLNLLLAGLCINIPTSYAIPCCQGVAVNPLPYGWFANIDGGGAWPYLPTDFTVPNGLPSSSGFGLDQYSTNSPTNGIVAVMGGYQWIRNAWWFPGIALSVRYQHFFVGSIGGAVVEKSLPLLTDYKYSFDTSADLISLYSKISLFYNDRFIPYVDVGIGAARTDAKNYQEMAFSGVVPRINPEFKDHTQNNFAYNIGTGLDFLLTPQLSLSLGYDFQFLGPLQTGYGVSIWSDKRLSIGDYTANVVTVGVTYFLSDK